MSKKPKSLSETAEIISIPGVKESIEVGLEEAKYGQGIELDEIEENLKLEP